ncbi:tyrosine protein phosphatase [Fictibacillus sp. KIGAM418]|uniref:Tyrosine-protein phosphatase n=1 Tax=Fictibacillus marinisediminis TaxID=2878389 RepID=A0A9X1XG73_9BACL|nr:CpsB/CapC family capsule biosynthesis tyrosine phosphatase [Fictibacillus marinisediminis]MCK6259028.1 tyrosine protein phosphatase [Fictibacillus marinisediminis]
MIDVHSHILPQADDGAPDLAASLDMAKSAVQAGITTLFATPHHRNGKYDNSKQAILHKTKQLNEALIHSKIPLTILPGQEIRIYAEFLEDLENNQLLTLNDLGKYILIELPFHTVPSYTNHIVYECMLKDITPIIVHPERNSELMENPHVLYDLVKEGALTQITASSIIGRFGKNVKSFSHKIIRNHWTHFVASDAHNCSTRGFHLGEAYEEIGKKHGTHISYYLRENAQLIVNNHSIYRDEPKPAKKKRLGIF